ncbi:MauE/DoxX family redox-associated membrane protein [Sinosporangium siamense]|uniref:Methylamine utilisation protein MauE domain-containing protein n=1 Tax=Sinosporangium siamense TaxID=1367973 RepID=A0A919RLL1_9ACTN|nr:MauE/DoxX family redox-associated membrane protein [Sinosporangium siamense]GII95828.1 hypothetical protein Ssi02_60590 [Sinosporangium siamense]
MPAAGHAGPVHVGGMMEALGVAVRLAAALLLMYAAAQKLAVPRPFRQTLEALRVPAVRAVALLVPAAETAAAVGLLAAPGNPLTGTLVAGLGFSFAGAALVAMRRGESIRCACYGQEGESDLGVRQLVALPLWLGVAAVSMLVPPGEAVGVPLVAAAATALAVFAALRTLLVPALRNRSYLKTMESLSRRPAEDEAGGRQAA